MLAAGAAVAVLSSVIPYSLEMWALRSLAKKVFAVLIALEPAAAALAGVLVIGQTLDAFTLVAIALVVTAGRRHSRHESKTHSEVVQVPSEHVIPTHRRTMPNPIIATVLGNTPQIDESAFIAPNATVVGAVTIAAGASIWYGAVIRGDAESISIGADTNIQDNCTVHADPTFPAVLGERISVGHNAVLHGCTVEETFSSAWVPWCSTAHTSARGH